MLPDASCPTWGPGPAWRPRRHPAGWPSRGGAVPLTVRSRVRPGRSATRQPPRGAPGFARPAPPPHTRRRCAAAYPAGRRWRSRGCRLRSNTMLPGEEMAVMRPTGNPAAYTRSSGLAGLPQGMNTCQVNRVAAGSPPSSASPRMRPWRLRGGSSGCVLPRGQRARPQQAGPFRSLGGGAADPPVLIGKQPTLLGRSSPREARTPLSRRLDLTRVSGRFEM